MTQKMVVHGSNTRWIAKLQALCIYIYALLPKGRRYSSHHASMSPAKSKGNEHRASCERLRLCSSRRSFLPAGHSWQARKITRRSDAVQADCSCVGGIQVSEQLVRGLATSLRKPTSSEEVDQLVQAYLQKSKYVRKKNAVARLVNAGCIEHTRRLASTRGEPCLQQQQQQHRGNTNVFTCPLLSVSKAVVTAHTSHWVTGTSNSAIPAERGGVHVGSSLHHPMYHHWPLMVSNHHTHTPDSATLRTM